MTSTSTSLPYGPLPTRLRLLADLVDEAVGSKVRFLGCVNGYHVDTGTLRLEHDRRWRGPNPDPDSPNPGPRSRLKPRPSVTAWVDVALVLEQLAPGLLATGEWVNVMGYVAPAPSPSMTSPTAYPSQRISATKRADNADNAVAVAVHIQAVLLWSAGGVRVEQYERAVEQQQQQQQQAPEPEPGNSLSRPLHAS
ncbi:MAG: hypothetical protein M1826_002547 [Phylliscum demangeonii]|nr:MAG: hypothetical protein M1826_002547 [Phylliscum demangeonii]